MKELLAIVMIHLKWAITCSGGEDTLSDFFQTVKRNQQQYEMPLKILSYDELYGWTMDKVVSQVGRKNNCTFCGVFRRQALDRGAAMLEVDHIVTGHNADDIAETVLMNSERTNGFLLKIKARWIFGTSRKLWGVM